MRKRDLGILFLCAVAVFFSLQQEGDFSFREAWFHLSEEYPVKYEADRLPPPIIADLNGDGKSEVLVATHDAKIQVLEPHTRRVDEGYSEARVLGEVSLLPDKVRISFGRRAVAMAVGMIGRTYKDSERKKQVLVVVTSGWSVMCFDHNLKKLWEHDLQEDFPHGTHHREVAILITNYTLKHGDAGLVIVGGRMDIQHYMSADLFEETLMGTSEKDTEHHRRSTSEKENKGSDALDHRHFALYAFAGGSGALRLKRKNEDIQMQQSDPSMLIPQHNYKLDAQALNARHPGEFECREFRESVLGIMPHHWDRREDTSLELAHFRRHKRKLQKKSQGKSINHQLHPPSEKVAPGKDSSNKIAGAIGKAAKYANSAKVKQRMMYYPTITNHTRFWWVPNVIVVHEKEGIEVIHLPSGRTLCKLHLPEGGLHADINGDGVLDHVQAVGGRGVERSVVTGSMEVLKPCWAVATSGVPVREQLFNVSICPHTHFNIFHQSGGDLSWALGNHRRAVAADAAHSLEVATPVLLPRADGHKHRKGSHGDVIFLNSRGEMTSYYPGLVGGGAEWRWQLVTGASWKSAAGVVPTLAAVRLRAGDDQDVVIAAGEKEVVLVSPGGNVVATVELPAAPTHALVVGDFDGDGLADLIIPTAGGVYGLVQTRTPGAVFFSTLVGCLVVVMGVIFVAQHLGGGTSSKPRGFSR
ncbi:FG-GAP repeat-containing protein [Wolffia australiana]